jgi:hypothetical protein
MLPGPGGRKWRDSTIRGHIKRGTGIINNELYVGRLIWNRQHFVKDPSTGKRLARMNAPDQWVTQELPALKIISDNLWKSVKAKQQEISYKAKEKCVNNQLTGSRRSKYLLSGLLICGKCQGGFTLIAKDRYGCANRRNNGTCNNDFLISRKEIEQRILSGLHDKLLEPQVLNKFIDDYIVEVGKLVPLPTIISQREIVSTIKKIGLIKDKVTLFEEKLDVDPLGSSYSLKQIDEILEVIGELDDADKVKSIIRAGESKKTEFKETLSLDIKKQTKEKYIEDSAIKTIAAFLNTEGGTLLIGVADSGQMKGVETEISKFHSSKDKFLLHFKNLLRDRIGELSSPH